VTLPTPPHIVSQCHSVDEIARMTSHVETGTPGDGTNQLVRADRQKLKLLSSLVGLFLFGGIIGALGFHRVGFISAPPLAGILIALATVPIIDDLRAQLRPLSH
jgi:hypothetical protein